MDWITYVLVPLVCGIAAVAGGRSGGSSRVRDVAPGLALLGCALLNTRDFLAIASVLSRFGLVVFLVLLVVQGALGGLLVATGIAPRARGRVRTVRRALGIAAIVGGVVMTLVTFRLIELF